ncbi:hypothetical protein KC19_6G112200 [Ceratodon purpureus]|uniref:Fe2OG dioxygenase domain-containing protein n=1 Tax=Ceratodon purpureus TaxID=3225 RepID=A0A8T0HEL8_CERPU|nr:hypothetical protein KC19_6G112200 [Ceratodon purpureus]
MTCFHEHQASLICMYMHCMCRYKSKAPMEGVETQRQQLFIDLAKALWIPSDEKKQKPSLGTFALCETVKYSDGFILPSFHVEGVGELRLPLCAEDSAKLRSVCEQAPFGKGSATLVDTRVRRCWQVDASKISFPGVPEFLSKTVQGLVTKAVASMGLVGDSAQLEAHLYKLLFYEPGGHFSVHRDTEKEKGMFATLILQLPTDEGYTGGKLVVKHHNETKKFDAHMVSTLGFCYTVFFADCLHELEEIETGTRLCLAFNLVKRDCSLDPRHMEYISNRVGKVETAFQLWMEEASQRKIDVFGAKMAIPLQHKYTEGNLSFSGLKGEDSVVAELLKECRDQNGEKWLSVHFCLVTKYLLDEGDECYTEETLEFKNWTQLDDSPPFEAIEKLSVDMEKETIIDPFNDEPDDEEYAGARVEQWYHRAMLVVWPKLLSMAVACEAGVSGALDQLESDVETGHPSFKDGLHQIVSYCENHAPQAWHDVQVYKPIQDPVTPRLLNLCIKSSVLEDAMRILQLLAKTVCYETSGSLRHEASFKVGLRNFEVANVVSSAIQVFGWDSLSPLITSLVKECALTQGEPCAQLAKQLISIGIEDAGVIVAETTFKVFESLITDLESHKMPEFSWHQPKAKLPGYPGIESFLRGPLEKYVYKGGGGLPAMRAFGEKHFCQWRDRSINYGYSAIGTPDGRGQGAFCVIQKTRRVYERRVDIWRVEQARLNRLKLELEKLRSLVPRTNPVNPTSFFSASASGERKRGREDVEVTTNTEKRPRSSS